MFVSNLFLLALKSPIGGVVNEVYIALHLE